MRGISAGPPGQGQALRGYLHRFKNTPSCCTHVQVETLVQKRRPGGPCPFSPASMSFAGDPYKSREMGVLCEMTWKLRDPKNIRGIPTRLLWVGTNNTTQVRRLWFVMISLGKSVAWGWFRALHGFTALALPCCPFVEVVFQPSQRATLVEAPAT